MTAFLFIPLLAATSILAFLMATVVSHYFLSIIQSSAAGNEAVDFADEPFLDWFGKVFGVAALVMPTLLVSWIGATLPIGSVGGFGLGQVVVFSVVMPIVLLSSLMASSKYVPFLPEVLERLAKRLSAGLGFYLLSLPVIALTLVGIYWSISKSPREFTPLQLPGAILTALGLMLYAHLLGRLAFVLSFAKLKKTKRKRPRPTEREEESDDEPTVAEPIEAPIHTPLQTPDGPVTGYGLSSADPTVPPPPPSRRNRMRFDDDDDEPLAVAAEADPPAQPDRPPIDRAPRFSAERMARETELASSGRRRKEEPTSVWSGAFLAGLLAPQGLLILGMWSSGFLLLGAMGRGLRMLKPE